MGIKYIELHGGNSIQFPAQDLTGESPYILKSVDGLGPPEFDVTISNSMNGMGTFQGRRAQLREPVILLTLNPDYQAETPKTVEDLRLDIYNNIEGSSSYPGLVYLTLVMTSGRVLTTQGYIKKVEITPFNKEQEVQVTMACDQAYLSVAGQVHYGPMTYPDIYDNTLRLDNIGSAPCGVAMNFTLNRAFPNGFGFKWQLEQKLFKIAYPFAAGDVLRVITTEGTRRVTLNDGVEQILGYMTADSSWPYLGGGGTNFYMDFDVTGLNEWTVSGYYNPQDWGI